MGKLDHSSVIMTECIVFIKEEFVFYCTIEYTRTFVIITLIFLPLPISIKETKLMYVDPRDLARVAACMYGIIGALYAIIGLAIFTFSGNMTGLLFVVIGVMFTLIAAGMVYFMTWILNWFLKKVGGIRVAFSE
jgi:hypothetical protein